MLYGRSLKQTVRILLHRRCKSFFDMLKASEESLHEHTTVSVLTFITRITSIKSKFAFSNKCYKELLRLFNDVLPSNHKMPKDMYQPKKLLFTLSMEYEKIDVCRMSKRLKSVTKKLFGGKSSSKALSTDTLFQGCSTAGRHRAEILRHMDPSLVGSSTHSQRDEVTFSFSYHFFNMKLLTSLHLIF
jgi:hypothetical protein